MRRSFRSKIDWWLGALLVTAAAFELGISGIFLMRPDVSERWFSLLALGVATFMLWVLFGTTYSFADEALLVRSGPFRWRVPYAEIEEVLPTRDPLSAPACSLDRLRINHRRRGKLTYIVISPADKRGFLDALAEVAPQAAIRT